MDCKAAFVCSVWPLLDFRLESFKGSLGSAACRAVDLLVRWLVSFSVAPDPLIMLQCNESAPIFGSHSMLQAHPIAWGPHSVHPLPLSLLQPMQLQRVAHSSPCSQWFA